MAKSAQKSSIYSKLFLAFFALLPLIYVESLLDNTLVPRQLYTSAALIIVLLFMWRDKWLEKFSPGAILLFFLGFVLINMLSVTVAINPVESWAISSRYALAFAYLAIALMLLRAKKISASDLVFGIVIFGGITALITLFNLFKTMASGDFFADIYSVTGTFGHKNLLSSALMLSFPFAVMGTTILTKPGWRKFSLFLALLLVAEMFVLRTRGVWLSMFVATFVTLIAYFLVSKKKKTKGVFPFKWVGIGAVMAVIILIGLFSSEGVQDSVSDRSNLDRRLVFWQNSLSMIRDNPVMGVGAGNWRIEFPKYGLSSLDENRSDYQLGSSVHQGITHIQRPHNDYLWVWTESGILGLLFFLGIFVVALWRLLRNLRSMETPAEMAMEMSLLFGLVAYLTFSITDFPLERTTHNILLMSLLALVFRKELQPGKFQFSIARIFPLLLLALGFSLFISGYRWQGDKYSLKVTEAYNSRNVPVMVRNAEEGINAFYNMDPFANPLRYYTSLGKIVQNNPAEALQDGLEALEVHPYNIIVLNHVGNLYKQRGDNEQALKYYLQATDISVMYEAAQLNKAEIYAQRQEWVNAMRSLMVVQVTSQNPKYRQMLQRVLPSLVATSGEHQTYPDLVNYIRERQPKNSDDYVRYYLTKRREMMN